MAAILSVALGILALALVSALAVYAYGRWARRAGGPPSAMLPVEERATALDRIAADRIAGRDASTGLRLVEDNLDAFAIRAWAARNAGRSLDLQYYYWDHDLTGTLLAAEVLRAADRGVRVRILLDDINLRGRDRRTLALDKHQNIEVRVFNPCWNRVGALQRGFEILFRAYSSTRRMHNKAWIGDARLAIVGGRNIGDAYYDASETINFRDLDLVLVGRAVADAGEVFDRFWNSDCVLPIASLPRLAGRDLDGLRREMAAVEASRAAEPYLGRIDRAPGLLDDDGALHWCETARIVSDPPAKSRGGEADRWLHKAIVPMVLSARRRVEITSPYFIPGKEGVRQLRDLVGRGVRVSILTNSLAATDVAAVHGAYAPYRRPLIRAGIELYELKPEIQRSRMSLFGSSGASLHTKAFTVDEAGGFVGSFNFDPRSVSLNTEMGVIFEQADLADEVRAVFAEQVGPQASYRVVLDGMRLGWRDDPRGRLLRGEPAAGLWRRFVACAVGLLPLESQL